jgi:multidrug efflux pump subunit AcrB
MSDALNRIEAAAREAERQLAGGDGKLILTSYVTLGQIQLNRGENLARIEIELTPGEDRSIRTPVFAQAWKAAVPSIAGLDTVAVVGRRAGPPGSDIDVRLTGASIDTLKNAAVDLRRTLESYTGLVGIADDLPYGEGEVLLEVTPRGNALGFTTEIVSRTVREKYQGAIAVRFARGDDEVTIRVRGSEIERNRGLAGLLELTLKSPGGVSVPLSEVVKVVEQQAFAVVQRHEGKLAVSVTADVDGNITTPDQVIAALEQKALPDLRRKHGIKTSFEGRAETQRQTFADLRIGTVMALLLIYLVLAFVFQRWLQPLLVMSIIPFGFVGMVVGHYAMGFNMALFSFIGLLGLSGIVVNGAIVLVDRMNERIASGESLELAATGAAADRFRAILLTTLTTIGGMSPLLFEKSLQAQFLIPIALTLCFGLAFATFILLFLLPALIGIGNDMARLAAAMGRLFAGRPRDEAA